MGVINLGDLIAKIKNKLSGDFITSEDVATASAVGVVSIGDNVDVDSNGEISVPLATTTTPGVASFSSSDFSVSNDGAVSLAGGGGGGGGGCVDLFVRTSELSNNVEYDLSADASDCKVLFIFTFDTDYPNITGHGTCNFAFVPEATSFSPNPEYSVVTAGLSTNPGCVINLAKTKFKMSNGSSRFQIQRIVGLK